MVERAIIPPTSDAAAVDLKDNVSIINATNLKPLVSIAETVEVCAAYLLVVPGALHNLC